MTFSLKGKVLSIFPWACTPEGPDFWQQVNAGKSPPIPTFFHSDGYKDTSFSSPNSVFKQLINEIREYSAQHILPQWHWEIFQRLEQIYALSQSKKDHSFLHFLTYLEEEHARRK